jgi:serine/threonine protein kinase
MNSGVSALRCCHILIAGTFAVEGSCPLCRGRKLAKEQAPPSIGLLYTKLTIISCAGQKRYVIFHLAADNRSDSFQGWVSSSDHSYVLKTYTGEEARVYYEREVEAFMRLADYAKEYPNPHMIGYYGSFEYQGTYNIILEYADQGTLEDYMKNTLPPTGGHDIIAFWESFLQVIKPIARLHEQDLEKNHDPNQYTILQGYVSRD